MATVPNSNMVSNDASFSQFGFPANLSTLSYDCAIQNCFVTDFDVGEDYRVCDLHISADFNVFSYDRKWPNFGFFTNSNAAV